MLVYLYLVVYYSASSRKRVAQNTAHHYSPFRDWCNRGKSV